MKYEKYKGSESDLQKAVAIYLDFMGVLWFHCPNGGTRNKKEAANLKRQGVKGGVPDICIMEPTEDFHGLFIELKVGYNKTSEKQKDWLNKLNNREYKVAVCYSFDECKEVINQYFKN